MIRIKLLKWIVGNLYCLVLFLSQTLDRLLNETQKKQ